MDVILVNIYAPNIGVPKHIKPILIDPKEEIASYAIIIKDSNTPFSTTDRSSRQKNQKGTLELNYTLDQTFTEHSVKAAEYIFSSKHGTFSRTDRVRPQNKY